MAKIIDGFPKIIFCKIPEIIMLMIPNAGIIKKISCLAVNGQSFLVIDGYLIIFFKINVASSEH